MMFLVAGGLSPLFLTGVTSGVPIRAVALLAMHCHHVVSTYSGIAECSRLLMNFPCLRQAGRVEGGGCELCLCLQG